MPFGFAGVLASQPVQVVAEGAAVRQARLAAAGDRRVPSEYLGDHLAEAPAVQDDMVAGPDQQGLVAGELGDGQAQQRGLGQVHGGVLVVQDLLQPGAVLCFRQ